MFEGHKKLKDFFFPAAEEGSFFSRTPSLNDLCARYSVRYDDVPVAKVTDPDPLVDMGIDNAFEAALKSGEQPGLLIDDTLQLFAMTGSKRGIDICIDAGADPLVAASVPWGKDSQLNAIQLAEKNNRPDLADHMKAYTQTPLYQERMVQRAKVDYNTLYLRAMIHGM
jgi:hypothetical protein